MDPPSQIFHSSIWHRICIFLPFRDIFSLLLTAKSLNHLINEHFKYFLRQQNLTNERNEPKGHNWEKNENLKTLKEVTQTKYATFLQYFYCREIIHANFVDAVDNIKINRLNKMTGIGIKNLYLGYKLSSIAIHDGSFFMMKSEELFDSTKKLRTIRKEEVCKVDANSKNLIYLNSKKEISFLLFDDSKTVNDMKHLNLNLKTPVFDFVASFTHLILVVRSEDLAELDLKDGWNSEYFLQNKNLNYHFFVMPILDITEEIINNPISHIKIIQSPKDHPIKIDFYSNLCVSSSFLYLTNQDDQLIQTNITHMNSDLNLSLNPNLIGKHIIQIFAGLHSCFAIEKEVILPISEWKNEEVLKWAESIGFEDYVKILKYENVSGKQLANADKNFLIDKLGITKVDLQLKFLTEISNNSRSQTRFYSLFAWGANHSAQLGTKMSNNLLVPTKIKLPNLEKKDEAEIAQNVKISSNIPFQAKIKLPNLEHKDEIEKILVGQNISALLTKSKRIFVTGMSSKSTKKGKEEEEKQEKKDKKKGKKDKEGEGREKSLWVEIGDSFRVLSDHRKYEIIDLFILHDALSVLGSYLGLAPKKSLDVSKKNFASNAQVEEPAEKKLKFKTVEAILDRIQWDQNVNKKEFKIGVKDRFLGILEIELEEYLASSEIKEHRVVYFKRLGEVVWDKEKRIDHLWK